MVRRTIVFTACTYSIDTTFSQPSCLHPPQVVAGTWAFMRSSKQNSAILLVLCVFCVFCVKSRPSSEERGERGHYVLVCLNEITGTRPPADFSRYTTQLLATLSSCALHPFASLPIDLDNSRIFPPRTLVSQIPLRHRNT